MGGWGWTSLEAHATYNTTRCNVSPSLPLFRVIASANARAYLMVCTLRPAYTMLYELISLQLLVRSIHRISAQIKTTPLIFRDRMFSVIFFFIVYIGYLVISGTIERYSARKNISNILNIYLFGTSFLRNYWIKFIAFLIVDLFYRVCVLYFVQFAENYLPRNFANYCLQFDVKCISWREKRTFYSYPNLFKTLLNIVFMASNGILQKLASSALKNSSAKGSSTNFATNFTNLIKFQNLLCTRAPR